MIAPVLEARDDVALVQPLAALDGLRDGHGLPREVEIQGARHVHAVARHEQAEGSADPRVDVEDLVLPVAGVEAIPDVEDAAVAELLHPASGRLIHHVVAQADAEAGGTGVDGRLAQLAPRDAKEAVRRAVEVAVEHPHVIVAARDVLLQHQVGVVRILHLLVEPQQLGETLDDDHLPARALVQAIARDALEHHGEGGPARKRANILDSGRERCRRRRHGVPAGKEVHVPLVGQRAREVRRLPREQESIAEHVGEIGDQQRGLVPGRDEDRWRPDPRADVEQLLDRCLRCSRGEIEDEAPAEVPRVRGRATGIRIDREHRDAETPESAQDAEPAVGRSAGPRGGAEHEDGRAGVDPADRGPPCRCPDRDVAGLDGHLGTCLVD